MSTENDVPREFPEEFPSPASQLDDASDISRNPDTTITDTGAVKAKSRKTLVMGAAAVLIFIAVAAAIAFVWMKKPVPVHHAGPVTQQAPAAAPGAALPATSPSAPSSPATPPVLDNPLNSASTPAVAPPPPVGTPPVGTPSVDTTSPPVSAPVDPLANLAAAPAASGAPAVDPLKALPSATPAPVGPPAQAQASAPPVELVPVVPDPVYPPQPAQPAPTPETVPLANQEALLAGVRAAVRTEISPLSARVAVLEDRMDQMGSGRGSRRDAGHPASSAKPVASRPRSSAGGRPAGGASSGTSSSGGAPAARSSHHRASAGHQGGNRIEVLSTSASSVAPRERARPAPRCVAQSIIPGQAWIKAADGSFKTYAPGDAWSDGTLISDIDPSAGIKAASGRTLCEAAR